MKNCLIINCSLLFVSQSMFMIVAVFLFGYSFGYYLFEIFKYKNQKDDFIELFSSYNKNIAQSMELLTKEMQEIKIEDDVLLGNDLSFEQKFLNNIVDKCSEEIENCEVSFYFSKKSMTICCETLIITETIAKSLLDIVGSVMKQHFTSSLRQLGWCAHYMLHRRTITYAPIKSSLMPKKWSHVPDLSEFYWLNKKRSPQFTELTEFYWFINSPSRSFKKNSD